MLTRTNPLLISARWLFVALCFASCFARPAFSQALRGHGGPVRALAITPDGATAVTGSFDQAVIVWTLDTGGARTVLRGHEGAVNAALALSNDRFVTGGDDGRVIFWKLGSAEPLQIFQRHEAPIAALAASPDGGIVASASWDGAVRLWSTQGEIAVLKGHTGQVTSLVYLSNGALVSGGYDGTVRIWRGEVEQKKIALGTPVNSIVASPAGFLAGCADGKVRFFNLSGEKAGEIEIGPTPIVALAIDASASRAIAGSIDGRVVLFDPNTKSPVIFQQSRGWPVWSLAFSADGKQFFSGGGDGLVRRWDAQTGQPTGQPIVESREEVPPELRETRGAEVFRACIACHTLANNEPRAGPTLHGIIGRRIATEKSYRYSAALTKLDIVWSKETIAKLFEVGPATYTPGTKMPEQRLNAADRQALVDFLEKATR